MSAELFYTFKLKIFSKFFKMMAPELVKLGGIQYIHIGRQPRKII